MDNEQITANAPLLSIVICIDQKETLGALKQQLQNEGGQALEIIAVEKKDRPDAVVFKEGFQKAKGTYVSFIHASGYYTEGSLRSFIEREEKNGLIFCFRSAFKNPKGSLVHYLPRGPRGLRNIHENPTRINLTFSSYLIPRALIKPSFFTTGLTEEACLYGLIELIEQEGGYWYLPRGEYVFTNGLFDGYNYPEQYNKDWYTKTLRNEWMPLLDKYPDSRFVQSAVYYLLCNRYLCNWNTRDDGILEGKELDGFLKATQDLLQELDDVIIIDGVEYGPESLQKNMRYHLLTYKYPEGEGRTKHLYTAGNHIGAYNRTIVGKKSDIKCYVYDINYEKGQLFIDGRLSFGYFLNKNRLRVYMMVDGMTEIEAVPNNIYSLGKYFGLSMDKAYTFQLAVPAELFREGAVLRIYYEHEGRRFPIPFTFGKIQARLSLKYGASYWQFGDWIMTCPKRDGRRALRIRPAGQKERRKAEKNLVKAYIRDGLKKKNRRALKAALLRIAYNLTKKKYADKHVWITFDQLFKGGDNGEYFFRYVADHNQRKDILPYYVINKTAVEYAGLKKKYGRKVIIFNSFRCKLMALHAEIIFATRADAYQYVGIAGALGQYVRDLCNARVVCLQHGLTIQRIAQYQNRLFDNTRAYFLVSPLEKKNIMHEAYGYTEDQLYMTGAPRYDGLVSDDHKQILITPTWRRSVTSGTNTRGQMHEYSVNFKNTEYFKIYNSLISDERLIRTAEETGYKLIYLIHPILSPQIGDFQKSEHVEIIPGSEVNYERILSESSLMLTDYSGIQFDFAYMRKPVVYYHPDTLPPQYDSNVYDYETEALGPVCKNHEQIVDALCRYMRNQCKMEAEYEERVNRFFAFSDRESARRVYEAALAYMDKYLQEDAQFELKGRKAAAEQEADDQEPAGSPVEEDLTEEIED